jgi:hypothetical protein
MPNALLTAWIDAGELVCPLYVTVNVPLPTGVIDGNMAFTWLLSVPRMIADT